MRISAVSLFLCIAIPSQAATIFVPDQHPTIQAALDQGRTATDEATRARAYQDFMNDEHIEPLWKLAMPGSVVHNQPCPMPLN